MLLARCTKTLQRSGWNRVAKVSSNVVGLGTGIIDEGRGRDRKGVIPLQEKRWMRGGKQMHGIGG
jgi:hypothetical protein